MKAAALGVLLLAHGGAPEWNAEAERVRARVDAKAPAALALGMADPATIQAGIDALQARGVGRIVAVPLFVNSRSEVLDQTRYVLGLRDEPSEVLRAAYEAMARAHAGHGAHAHAGHSFSTERARARVPVVMTGALDDAPLVSRILLERARGLSRRPAEETVVLVAHGPVDDAAVAAWDAALARHAQAVRRGGGFKSVSHALLRDDAAPAVRSAAVAALRAKVAAGGRVLVVPALLARGGIEGKLARDLRGLEYAWDGKTLMPHEGFDEWVLARARAAK